MHGSGLINASLEHHPSEATHGIWSRKKNVIFFPVRKFLGLKLLMWLSRKTHLTGNAVVKV